MYEVHDELTINDAFAALFIWESIIVLDREAILFWKTPLTGPSLLYLANKYTFLAITVLDVLNFDHHLSVEVRSPGLINRFSID